jgi:hypothetical protein
MIRQAIAALAGSAAPDEPTDGQAEIAPVPAPASPTD